MVIRPDGNSRPDKAAARKRMREAQRLEAAALDAVTRADQRVATVEQKVARAIQAGEADIEAAKTVRASAVAKLVEVSGVDRAAMLLSQPAAEIRQAVRIGNSGVARPAALPAKGD